MENLGICNLKSQLEQLNSGTVHIDFSTYPTSLVVRCADCDNLNLPEGYYLNEKNVLTNEGNTASGLSESYRIITELIT